MRILFFSHYFPPEVNAPATRTYEHCRRWAESGHEVTMVTCVPNCPDGVVYEGYHNHLWRQIEWVDGIRVVRVWTYLAPNAGTVRRIANYLSFLVSAMLASIRLERPDVVVATSPQFFCGWAGVLVSSIKRVPFVLEIRDIWPESIRAVGALKNGLILRFLEVLERRMYRAASQIVTVGRGYREKILEKVDLADRTTVITNGVNLDHFRPEEPYPKFLHQWDLEDKFVCSYVGTLGMAHGLEVVVEAAVILKQRGRDDVRFCLVGDGAQRRILESEARRRGVDDQIVFTGRLPKEEMPMVLASSDACLIHLKKCELFGTVLPSKLFETMAMARPIILGVEGEARDLLMQAGAALMMEPEDAASLVDCLLRLAEQPHLAAELGTNGRNYVAECFDRDELAFEYLKLLHRVAGIPVEEADRATEPVWQPTAAHQQPVTSTN